MRPGIFPGSVLIIIALIVQIAAAQARLSPEMSAALDLVRKQQWPDAERALAAVVKAEPKNGRAWFNLGIARHSQEKWESAVEAFKKTVEISQNPLAMYNIAAGYARLGKADPAFERLAKALDSGARRCEHRRRP